jgi:hypothetical protein
MRIGAWNQEAINAAGGKPVAKGGDPDGAGVAVGGLIEGLEHDPAAVLGFAAMLALELAPGQVVKSWCGFAKLPSCLLHSAGRGERRV